MIQNRINFTAKQKINHSNQLLHFTPRHGKYRLLLHQNWKAKEKMKDLKQTYYIRSIQ